MKEFIGKPAATADEPDGSGQSDHVGRGAEPRLVHEGQDRPALVLRPRRAGTARSVRRILRKHRAAIRFRAAVSLRRRRVSSSSAWAGTWRRRKRRSTTCASERDSSGLPERLLFSAVSRRSKSSRRSAHCQAFTVLERMDDPLSTTGNHLTREIKAAFCDAMTGQNGQDANRSRPAHLFRLGRAGQPRRAARRYHRHLREHGGGRPGLLLRRHRSSTGAPGERRPRPARRGRVLDARSFRRRLRLGDHEQGDRHDCRRRLRQGRAGLSEVRLGKEGAADDLLSDDRRMAHLPAQRVGARRSGRAERHDGPVQRQSAAGLVRGGAIVMQSSYADPADVWTADSAASSDAPSADRNAPRLLCRHGADRPRSRLGGRPADADAGHRPAWARSSSSRRTAAKAA